MSTITKYAVVENPEEWGDEHLIDSYQEAKDEAMRQCQCVVEVTFEYADAGMLDDFRPAHKRPAFVPVHFLLPQIAGSDTDYLEIACDAELSVDSVLKSEEEDDVTCPECRDIIENQSNVKSI